MMRFDNRPPINLEAAEVVARAQRVVVGAYSGIGYNRYTVYRGKRFHLVHLLSSGCEYNNYVDSSSTHIGHWVGADELAAYLKSQVNTDGDFPWWCSELLVELGVPGEDA
jgi:hypothetical protein